MHSISLDDFTAQVVAAEDIKSAWKPSDITHRNRRNAQWGTFCWSSIFTTMPAFVDPQLMSWRRDEALLREGERLAYDRRIKTMRQMEYPMLQDITYLDHGGTTLASKSLMDAFCTQMKASILSNPHSDASRPSFSALMVEQTRRKVLKLFSADPKHWDVVFTANATAAIKLVMECFAGHKEGFDYLYHYNAHTSLVGVREQAQHSRCLATAVETDRWLDDGERFPDEDVMTRPLLFAYPAQSNMNGERLPLDWASRVRSTRPVNTYTLLDAAALVSTTPLDLSDHSSAPDFISMSFYKVFGFPDLGALVVRKASAGVLRHRKYFGGGTTEMIGCIDTPWVERKESSVHARLEDGTIAIRSILALSCAIDTHTNLFGGLGQVSAHTGWLAMKLYDRLAELKHSNGVPVCHLYKALKSTYGDSKLQGATVAFNIRKSDGSWMSGFDIGAMLRANNIHLRTGSLCNPAGMASALGLSANDLRVAFDSGFRCNQPGDDIRGHVPYGMIRATLGAMSTLEDVETLVGFVEKHLTEHPHRTPRGSAGTGSSKTEDGSLAITFLNKEAEQVLDGTTPSARPGPKRNVWQALFSCYSRRK